MVKIKKIVLVSILVLFSVACELSSVEPPRKISYEATTSVKIIQEGVEQPDDPSTVRQESVVLNYSKRILVKSDELTRSYQSWNIDSDFKMAFNVYVNRADLSVDELNGIELCPLTKNWMIYATWSKAHPFHGGEWSTPGGDFQDSSCFAVASYKSDDILAPPSSPPSTETLQAPVLSLDSSSSADFIRIQFDVTNWFLNGPYAGASNNGFVLRSQTEILFWADSSNHKPNLGWTEPGER